MKPTPRPSGRDLALFIRQLALLVESGVSIQDALLILSSGGPLEEATLEPVLRSLFSGSLLSEALAQRPEVFPRFCRQMVAVGEKTGGLSECLRRLADTLERDISLVGKVRSAATYPLIVLSLAVGGGLLLAATVLPGFISVLKDLGGPLPWLTQFLVNLLARASQPHTWIATVIVLAVWGGFFIRWFRSSEGRQTLEEALLYVPVVGGLARKLWLSRLFGSLALTLRSGLTLTQGVALSSQACGSVVFEADCRALVEAITEGVEPSQYFASRVELYPSVVAALVEVGEKSGRLRELCERLSSYLEEEVSLGITNLLALLEPLLLAGVSLVVGGLLLALFLPLQSALSRL